MKILIKLKATLGMICIAVLTLPIGCGDNERTLYDADAGPDGDAADAGPDGDAADAGPDGDAADADAGPDGDAADAGPDGDAADAGGDTNTTTAVIMWEDEDAKGICRSIQLSDDTYDSFAGWHLNNESWAYYTDTGTPIWRYYLGNLDEVANDMSSDGLHMVGGAGNRIYGFQASSETPIWEYPIPEGDTVFDVAISEDGSTVYYSSGVISVQVSVTSLDVETLSPNWAHELPGNIRLAQLSLSGNDEKLVAAQYGWIVAYSDRGHELLRVETESQMKPALSHDGHILAVGDVTGHAIVYEYLEDLETYWRKWTYLFKPGSKYDWANALAVSGDGSTIAAGSTQFGDSDSVSGELAVFDSESNVPLWVFSSGDHRVISVDLSYDGAIIAAASWGPKDDHNADFWVFNKGSSIPFTEYNCPGSPEAVDLSSDGLRCIAGGKAVHAQTFGWGGWLYHFDVSQ
jgi:hypothetical protein